MTILRWFISRYESGDRFARVTISMGEDVPQDLESRGEDDLNWWGEEVSGVLSAGVMPLREEDVILEVVQEPVSLTALEEAEGHDALLRETVKVAEKADRWIVFTNQARQMAKRIYSEALGY